MIAQLFKEDKEKNQGKLAKWFVSTSLGEDKPETRYKRKYDFALRYAQYILGPDEFERIRRIAYRESTDTILRKALENLQSRTDLPEDVKNVLKTNLETPMIDFEDKLRLIIGNNLLSAEEVESIQRNNLRNGLCTEIENRIGEKWYEESLRGGSLDDVYVIMAHYLYLSNDPLWREMEIIYQDVLSQPNIPRDEDWLMRLLDRANTASDVWSLKFKEFYYGVVAAKYLQGHVIEAVKWMNDEQAGLKKIIREELKAIEPDPKKREQEEKKLFEILSNLRICFETPDARNPELGGRYMLWHPKQIYLAVKHTRNALAKDEKTKSYADKIFMIIDWEHVATQGVDPFHEAEDFVNSTANVLGDKNAGDLILGIHANYPSPLQPHKPIEIADRPVIYSLLYKLRKIGLGKNHIAYLLFERGGGENPFKASVIALRAIAEELEKDTPPDQLPITFYGISEGTRDYARQIVIIKEHALEPLKGLIKVPEEEYTFLSTAAIKAGKQPEQWKKEELR
jgi:hypothetical protein